MNDNSQYLLEHADFARRLALGLAGDTHKADDLVQDAWADVLTSPPSDDRSPRGFIATVLRRATARSIRSEQRRDRREQVAAQPEGLPATDEIAARLELHRIVVSAVENLAPGYRQVIVLRFFDGFTPAEIAERSGEPVETVRTRMKRAIAMLREKLDGDYGSRAGWVALVVPMSPIGSVAASAPVLLWMTVLMSRTTVGVLVVLLSLVGVWAAWSDGQSSAADFDPQLGASDSVVVKGSEASESQDDQVDAVRASVVSGFSMAGQVTVVDVDGGEHFATSGEIVAMIGDREHRIEVTDGQFTLQLDRPQSLHLKSMVFDGRAARVEQPVLEFSATQSIRVRWFADAVIRVVDAVTRRDLSDVTVLTGVLAFRGRVHPGTWKPENVMIEGAESPLALPPGDGVEGYWIHAEGYAWEAVKVERTQGGERVVALEPETSIAVYLDRYDPKWNMFVRLYRPETRPFGSCLVEGVAEQTSGGGAVVRINGLRAGDVRVEAHFGHWFDPPNLVAKEDASLVVGSTAEVVLTLDADGLPAPAVELAGSLHLPQGYEDLEVSLQLRPTSGPPMRKGDFAVLPYEKLEPDTDSGVVRWSFGDRSPGTYIIVVHPLQSSHEVHLKSQPLRDLRLQIPELADVLVTVTDKDSGQLADVDKMSWTGPSPEGVRMWPSEMIAFDEELGGFAFTAPLGEYRLSMRSDRYKEIAKRILVTRGASSLELETRELPSCWVEFRVGDTIVPSDWQTIPQVKRASTNSGRGRGRVREIRDGRAKVVVTEPGEYRIEFQKVLGFEQSEARTVTIGYGQTAAVIVPLQRSH